MAEGDGRGTALGTREGEPAVSTAGDSVGCRRWRRVRAADGDVDGSCGR